MRDFHIIQLQKAAGEVWTVVGLSRCVVASNPRIPFYLLLDICSTSRTYPCTLLISPPSPLEPHVLRCLSQTVRLGPRIDLFKAQEWGASIFVHLPHIPCRDTSPSMYCARCRSCGSSVYPLAPWPVPKTPAAGTYATPRVAPYLRRNGGVCMPTVHACGLWGLGARCLRPCVTAAYRVGACSRRRHKFPIR